VNASAYPAAGDPVIGVARRWAAANACQVKGCWRCRRQQLLWQDGLMRMLLRPW